MEFCNILKSNASFSFFPFISSIFNLRLPAVIFLFLFRAFFILFSTLVTYHSPILLSLIFPSLNFYFTLYKYSIFSKSSSPCPQFFLLFFRYNNSILGRRDSTSNIPAYNSFFRSFLGFSTTTSLSLDRDHSQNGTSVSRRRTPGYRKLKTWLFHKEDTSFLVANANWIEKWKGKEWRKKRGTRHLPYCHTFRFQVMPSLVHLVQSSLQHNSVILARQRAQQLPACAVQRRVHVSVRLDFRLEIL